MFSTSSLVARPTWKALALPQHKPLMNALSQSVVSKYPARKPATIESPAPTEFTSYVSINLLPVIEVDGGIKVAVQTEFFDKIFPNFLPMCVTLLCFWLLKKKQVSPIVLIVAIIVLSIVASAVGLL